MTIIYINMDYKIKSRTRSPATGSHSSTEKGRAVKSENEVGFTLTHSDAVRLYRSLIESWEFNIGIFNYSQLYLLIFSIVHEFWLFFDKSILPILSNFWLFFDYLMDHRA
jgi:hypothetical protein